MSDDLEPDPIIFRSASDEWSFDGGDTWHDRLPGPGNLTVTHRHGRNAFMSDADEPWEERVFREDAERRAWLEDALTRLESGLPGGDVTVALRQFARYMRTQIAEDEIAIAEYAAYEAGYGSDFPPERLTRAKDRPGLELALKLLAGKS